MRSPTILLLLLASFVGLSTSTIYWKNHVKTVQTQANLILFALRHKDVSLFYSLMPSAQEVEDFLVDHEAGIISVQVQTAESIGNVINGVLTVEEQRGLQVTYDVQVELTPNVSSPTGYIITKGHFCHFGDCKYHNVKF
ncbi:hypothetical protein CRE_06657 [Caenorhabditis remanei]|uniref:Uncharacterized protein n=1 Tax=Caenorhabditis remanei TaxID=31234 RepID=E3M0R6_CAERE|nr:hypothetical protein CRE_06657 [Caenorhabditis remanei]